MNREMDAHRNISPSEIDTMRTVFEKSIELTELVFGSNAFRRFYPGTAENRDGTWEQNKLNVSLWDTVLYTFSFYEKRQIVPIADRVREEFLDLMTSDPRFVEYIASTGDSADKVRYRADEWRRRLDRLVQTPSDEKRGFTLEIKTQLFEANPTCEICRQRIHDMDDAEVDHIKHYWRGGNTIPENARLAHRFCNRSRGGN